ncbi:hypothetical protein DB88DRAFT_507690 [Papiliotrema laurentii]|uniref:Pali-domain-containing protein n=1 Tax=Papiliotrema laurentii TaxID=5418 RepID=A0AAD9FX42_PAPLA|nr:hypothetical protein DB88DRAFT_507690 [Papiliotrema laurentii]
MLARSAFPAFFFTLAGFLLFLLTTLSVPIIKTIYMLKIKYPGGATAANVGVFGICYKGNTVTFNGVTVTGASQCTSTEVGYTLNVALFGLGGWTTGQVVIESLAGSLIMNAIAAGFAGISFLFAFFAWVFSSRTLEVILFVTLFLSALFGWIAYWINLGFVLTARSRVWSYSNNVFSGHIGNAFWMTFGGAIALTIAICLAGCGSFGRYSEESTKNRRDAEITPVTEEKHSKHHFWQRKHEQPVSPASATVPLAANPPPPPPPPNAAATGPTGAY